MTTAGYKVRSKMLKKLGCRNYAAYLAGEHWQQRRAAYEAAFGRQCRYCQQPAADLHHRSYLHLGAEPDEDLEWVCRDHHDEVQQYGVVKPASDRQKDILRGHGYAEAVVTVMSMGVAFRLIGQLSRGEIRSPLETAA